MRRYPVAIASAVALAAALLTLFLFHSKVPQSRLVPGSYSAAPKSAFDLAQEDALRRVVAVLSSAPDFAHANFGPGTRGVFYRVAWRIGDALVTPDGTLYVSVTPPNNLSNIDEYSVGTLYLGLLHLIPLPRLQGGYNSIGFVGNGVPPMIQAQNNNLGDFLFSLTPYSATELPIRQIHETTNISDLSSGERCVQPRNINSPFVLLASSPRGILRPLLTRAALQRATDGLIYDDRLISMYCTNFNGEDFVTLGQGGTDVVFRLGQNSLQLITRGGVFASGARHMLIWQTGQAADGTPIQDYLEVVSTNAWSQPNGGLYWPKVKVENP